MKKQYVPFVPDVPFLLHFRLIHLMVDTPKEIRKIENVIGIIKGKIEPGRYHILLQNI